MNSITVFIFISLLILINGSYNPIPIGSVIISTVGSIMVMQPVEYGGNDQLKVIFTALPGMTIVTTVYDPTVRDLYLLFTNITTTSSAASTSTAATGTNLTIAGNMSSTASNVVITSNTSSSSSTAGYIYVCRLKSLEQLDANVYQLPIMFDTANINQLNSFTSDITNDRVFLTDQTGTIHLFSMSGILTTTITPPVSITNPIRSAAYSNGLNQFYMVTDKTVYGCTYLDKGNLSCCSPSIQLNQLRSITFDQTSNNAITYVLDKQNGIYQVDLDQNQCPAGLRLINTLGVYTNLNFAIDRGLYFASANLASTDDYKYLVIANGTKMPRIILVNATIVELHVSIPNLQITSTGEESCFNGITYNDYRTAVIIAAIFGTIMGIFMCFNALFCIDFFMTKSIIRDLKLQIPHNLLEDRWNRLVEEKYAKIALEKQRKKDDPPPPPPPPRRKSSASGRKGSEVATSGDGGNDRQANTTDNLQVPNPLPKLSAFIRRKSGDYFSRRRSDDPRSQRQQSRQQFTDLGPDGGASPGPTQVHTDTLHEEHEHGLRPNLSRRQLLENDADFL